MQIQTKAIIFWTCFLWASHGKGQEMKFDSGCWRDSLLMRQKVEQTLFLNVGEHVDTVFVEDINGNLIEERRIRPLSRFEYYTPISILDQPRVYRVIQIEQQVRVDTVYIEDADGNLEVELLTCVIDSPKGSYEEFYRNGEEHWVGRVNGLDASGMLVKTGEWVEYDLKGRLVNRVEFP